MPPIVIVVCFPFKPREILARASRLSECPATRLAGDSFRDQQEQCVSIDGPIE